jgi:hypothetical protein
MSTSHLPAPARLLCAAEVDGIRRLWVLNAREQDSRALERRRERRLSRLNEIQEIARLACHGQVAAIVWARDCEDECGEVRFVIPASIEAYDRFRERQIRGNPEWTTTFRLAHVDMPFTNWYDRLPIDA